jgi:effector-binding domain-containing protein
MGFPYNVMGPIFKFTMKRQFGKGLSALEALAEKRIEKKEYFGYVVKEESILERHFVMSRSNVAIVDIQKYFTQSLGAIFQKVQNEGLTMKGMPSGLFFNYDQAKGMTDMAAAIPVNEEKAIKDLTSITLPKQVGLVIDYYGDFANTDKAHRAMEAYMKDRNLLSNPPNVEEYVTDPLQEKDPSKWLTKIIYYYSSNGM